MPRNPFSRTGRVVQPPAIASGKSFFVFPTSSALNADAQNMFPTDEDGVVLVWDGDIASAISSCVASRGDSIYVQPGTYTISTALAMSVASVRLIGNGPPGSVILTGSGANIINLTTTGCEIAGFTFNLATTKIAINMTAASSNDIHDNVFLSAVGGAASHFILMVTTACNYNRIRDNRFISNLVVAGGAITQTSHVTGLGIGNLIVNNLFVAGRVTTANTGTVTDGVVFLAAADTGNVVRENSFTEYNGGIFTAGIRTGASTVSGAAMITSNNLLLATAANAIVNTAGSEGFSNNIANGVV